MLFNSAHYALFLTLVFTAYWLLARPGRKIQNAGLLVVSYFFYACWDWRFLFLLVFSTLLDFSTGLLLGAKYKDAQRKVFLVISISVNLGFLAIFKYFNFFSRNAAELLSQMGMQTNPTTLDVILPVGISFYTFHGISYIIDVYKRRIEAEKSPVDYALFVSYFPLLVAGPIERATHLLPQLKSSRMFNRAAAISGLRQILWGLFKKMVIADNCALYVNPIFETPGSFSGPALLMGAMFFSVQIYCDFSGYSDIALGSSRLLGIELLQNFRFPYFSRDIAEFWRRWHISLSSWFRDYVYIPLGGSKGSVTLRIRNTLLIFLLSGFWHGANWTFVFWGLLHALFFIPLLLMNRNRANTDTIQLSLSFNGVRQVLSMFGTFLMVCLAWIFFRADSLPKAIEYIRLIFLNKQWQWPESNLFASHHTALSLVWIWILFMFIIEWLGRHSRFALERTEDSLSRPLRWVFYSFLIFLIAMFAPLTHSPFIYFQF